MKFDIDFAISVVPLILQGLGMTIWIAVAASLCAAVLGFVLEILRRSNRWLGYVMRFLIDVIRSTPVLVQLYFIYFVLPFYGVTLPAVAAGILGLSIYYSGYLAEVFKGGIDSIDSGQFEAGRALGLTRRDVIVSVILPQMLRNVAAPMGNYFVSALKATPYLAVIAVPEMLGIALEVGANSFRYAEPMVAVGIIFLILALGVNYLVRLMERRLQLAHQR
ncbi:ectoine/hydroxyectoine ABC transporter permease subunit EhuD [Bordetella trematum]|uniref:Binding-protein-dependent transport system inner membrane protein n=1 Tax=Bordetella trematum TaxID=123899 RepID=A0A157RU64_9BORD|nr:ectoine/hydroxyectoine ABC transporter permease subunit EhuD [Bordetella trematum]AZR92586.1 ectoine/hydroxyectoine ABC transporter permease subunit EhuD [Bordetella trematum]NNH19571.1 ectoine/hydroxyectoine ABC transporter permease subunit EhuD [Bordetella trematum]QIM71173.1 ectoine/hydroxyectoine ABC transporter permease subunit EhuD [Bordetella trematum]SAI55670.1 binding-protein-dependent transport system inner membrane protein [Bordetella trematum]SAI61543.1 binding-protein-dependent